SFRALAALEPQVCIVWSDGTARLLLHTLPTTFTAPTKLAQLLRFNCWLNPDDAGELEGHLEHLRATGEPFSLKVSALANHSLEATGAVCDADVVLRFRPLSEIQRELAPLMGENKRLKRVLNDKDNFLDALPIPIWIRDNSGALSWVNQAYATTVNVKGREDV